jgi:hypothetical protein
MSAQDGRQIASAARAAIVAGGMTAAEAQNWIDSLKPYLQFVNLASYFQLTIDDLQQIVNAGGQPPVVEKANANNQQPQDSAGQVVVNDQQARTEGSTVSNPSPTVTGTSNSIDTTQLSQPLSVDQQNLFNQINGRITPGTILPLSVTQATPPPTIQQLASSEIGQATVASQPGAGARNDDSGTVPGNSAKEIIKATFQTLGNNGRIITQPNILDDYASFTYQISWYLLSPQQYNSLQKGGRVNSASWSLLVQSGGAPLPPTSNTSAAATISGRSSFFPDDFYLDDLELTSKIGSRSNGLTHNVIQIKFKVIEPNGLTLLDRLFNAVNDLYAETTDYEPATNLYYSPGQAPVPIKPVPGNSKINYTKAQYALGIKFYGYDDQGNLKAPVAGRNILPAGTSYTSNVQNFIVQKIYAFNITELKCRMTAGQNSKGVEYHVAGAPVPMNNAFGQARGTVPFNFQLSGTTVQQLLVGKAAKATQRPVSDGRVSSTTPAGNKTPPPPPAPPDAAVPEGIIKQAEQQYRQGKDVLGNPLHRVKTTFGPSR